MSYIFDESTFERIKKDFIEDFGAFEIEERVNEHGDTLRVITTAGLAKWYEIERIVEKRVFAEVPSLGTTIITNVKFIETEFWRSGEKEHCFCYVQYEGCEA